MLRVTYSEMSRACDKQTSTRTNVVDDTAYSSASAPSWTQTTVADKHNILALRRLSGDFLTRGKTQ